MPLDRAVYHSARSGGSPTIGIRKARGSCPGYQRNVLVCGKGGKGLIQDVQVDRETG